MKRWISHVDQYGVRNYHLGFLCVLAVLLLYGAIALSAPLLLWFEVKHDSANIQNYADAFWTLQMSASTIGFGDYYPVSQGGRLIVAAMFYWGVGLVGFIGAVLADKVLGFADTSVLNRELRQQNTELMAHNRQLEEKLDRVLEMLARDS